MKLTRFSYGPNGTFGILEVDGKEYYTVEPPWNDNEVGRSCIPEGTYRIRRDFTGKFHGFRLEDVPGRTAIEMHKGSTMRHTAGCIIPGTGLGFVRGMWAVTNSAAAMRELKQMASGEDEIEITSVFAGTKSSGRRKKKASSETEE
jgi:hypothetical protein